jgi:mannitol/fructose-specific phosphotransferase system IIA component (Ntr-type)
MKIQKLIAPEFVYLDLVSSDIDEGLGTVANEFAPALGLDPNAVVDALLERERLGSTSVGGGFAIPHCKIQGLGEIAISLARFAQGVPFGAEGHDPVKFVFVVLSPPDQPAAHLQVLSQIARVLKRGELRADLLAAADADEVSAAICRTAEAEGL